MYNFSQKANLQVSSWGKGLKYLLRPNICNQVLIDECHPIFFFVFNGSISSCILLMRPSCRRQIWKRLHIKCDLYCHLLWEEIKGNYASNFFLEKEQREMLKAIFSVLLILICWQQVTRLTTSLGGIMNTGNTACLGYTRLGMCSHFILPKHYKGGALIVSIFKIRQLKHREVKQLNQGHTASKRQSWGLN